MNREICGGAMAVKPRPRLHRTPGDSFEGALVRLLDRLLLWRERARSRHMLGTLDERLLRDIGLDSATASWESTRPFWR